MSATPFISPKLIEPGMKSFIKISLNQCNNVRKVYNNKLYNLFFGLLFLTFLISILVYKYKGKLTKEEIEQKNIQKQQYILSKIKQVQKNKQEIRQELITGLPNFNNDFENIN